MVGLAGRQLTYLVVGSFVTGLGCMEWAAPDPLHEFWRAISLAFFSFGRGLGSSLRRSSGLGVLEARCTAAPGANATVTSHMGQRRAWCAQASTWCNALVLLDAGCCCWMPAAASRRTSSRRMLELQLFAADDSCCRCRLRMLCGNRIAVLLLFSMVSEQQQKLLRVVDNVREPGERALHRMRSGCNRRRLWRAVGAGVRPCDILQCTAVGSQ